LKYLGIPLSVRKLPKYALQYLVDKVADKLPVWKGHALGSPGIYFDKLESTPMDA
jgi:hypothetical protein